MTTAVPELGPSLGRLCEPPEPASASRAGAWIEIADLRLELVTELFDLAAAAREFASGGDRASATASLNRKTWLDLWDRTLDRVATRFSASVNARLHAAATESRFPARGLRDLLATPEETRGIAARLGVDAAPFVAALDAIEATVPRAAAAGPRGETAFADWAEAVASAARRLESAWLGLESALVREEAAWAAEIDVVARWRRPAWPLWVASAAVVSVAAYLGLVVGGYVEAPGWLRPFAEFWWNRG